MEFDIRSLSFNSAESQEAGTLLNSLLPKENKALLCALKPLTDWIKGNSHQREQPSIICYLELRCRPEFALRLLSVDFQIIKIGEDNYLIKDRGKFYRYGAHGAIRPFKKSKKPASEQSSLVNALMIFGGLRALVEAVEDIDDFTLKCYDVPARITQSTEEPVESKTCFLIDPEKLPGKYDGRGHVITEGSVCLHTFSDRRMLAFENIPNHSVTIMYQSPESKKNAEGESKFITVEINTSSGRPLWAPCELPEGIGFYSTLNKREVFLIRTKH